MAMPGARLASILYGTVALAVFGVLLVVASLLTLIVPGLSLRRRLIRVFARLSLKVLGLRIVVRGADHLPDASCIVVANHASYLDGVILKAVLPPRFTFVIKREAAQLPLAGLILRRIGAEFVDRASHGGRQATRDAWCDVQKPVIRWCSFQRARLPRNPVCGAFTSAHSSRRRRANQPLVPIVIRGTRRSMPSGAIIPRAGRIEVDILEPLIPSDSRHAAEELRREARRRMLARLDEPDLEPNVAAFVPDVTDA